MVAQRKPIMTGKELYGPVGAKEPILFNGKLGWIRVFCRECAIDYDIREVDNEITHPAALHVARFDCPKGHHCEARRLWNSYDDNFLKTCGIKGDPLNTDVEGMEGQSEIKDNRNNGSGDRRSRTGRAPMS
jgi:hypothetical protein